MMASAAFLFTVMLVVAVAEAAPQPDSFPSAIPFKSLPRDLLTHDPFSNLHTFAQDQHDVFHNQIIPGPFSSPTKNIFSPKFPSVSFSSASHSKPPFHQASPPLFSRPSSGLSSFAGASSFAAPVSAALHSPGGSFHRLGALDKVDKVPVVEQGAPVHFPSLGYDLDSYFTDFPSFGFFDFNPDKAGVTSGNNLPPFPPFPEDVPIKGGSDLHHAPQHPAKDVVTQLIHDKSLSVGPKRFRSRVPRRAGLFPAPPAMPTYPAPRVPRF